MGMLGGKNPFLVGHLSAKFEHVADTLERYFFFKKSSRRLARANKKIKKVPLFVLLKILTTPK